MKLRWRFGVLAGLFLMVCGMYPQLKMFYLRGNDWQGAYAFNDIDEEAYSAYLRALIDGRPRKNDPYTGRDDSPETPQPESLFSVQFATPYAVAIPARILGLTASTAMWISGGIAAFVAGLALFWLIGRITDDSFYAMAGALIVICGGALAAGEGAIPEILYDGTAYPYFPGLRRYVPALPFAAFFILCGAIWSMLSTEELKKRIFYCILSSVCFAFIVYSYFFIWTATAAWLACITLVWLIVRPENWLKDFKAFLVLGITCLASLVPYALMLSNRSQDQDSGVMLLVYTRMPDLWRVPELIGYSVIGMLILAVVLKAIKLKDRATLFTFSLALLPFILFNQQVITGHSLQPIHYQVFIGNYVAALSLVLMIGLLVRSLVPTRNMKIAFASLAIIAAIWGIVECHYTVRVLDDANVERDEFMPLAKRLTELSAGDVPSPDSRRAVVLSYSMLLGDDLPTIAPQAVLWARHQHVFVGASGEESKLRYYQYLYYTDLDENWLDNSLKEGDFISMITLFGWGRHTNRLSSVSNPLTFSEIESESEKFGDYINNFSIKDASSPTLSYVIVPTDWNLKFENLDKWYERDAGERIGKSILYKVKLRNAQK